MLRGSCQTRVVLKRGAWLGLAAWLCYVALVGGYALWTLQSYAVGFSGDWLALGLILAGSALVFALVGAAIGALIARVRRLPTGSA